MCSAHTGEDDSARCVDITWPAHQYLSVGIETTVIGLGNMETECGLIRFVQNKN